MVFVQVVNKRIQNQSPPWNFVYLIILMRADSCQCERQDMLVLDGPKDLTMKWLTSGEDGIIERGKFLTIKVGQFNT